jgi:hypothetical protein
MPTIDMTPTWEGILPGLIAMVTNGTVEARNTAMSELRRMAQLADKYVAQEQASHVIPEDAPVHVSKRSIIDLVKRMDVDAIRDVINAGESAISMRGSK